MYTVKSGIWWSGNVAWLFGLTDRTIAASTDGYVSALDLILIFTASLLFVSWLFLRPSNNHTTKL